ncbi:MAG: aminotransferase class V-fold PLP-dependent enzyme [Acidimicrobiales bacterium]|nr:aminotransferase class V-fold PLP-dependent enzyme [Acidimicrobiales bacterium]
MDAGELLRRTAERAIEHLEGLDERPVHATATLAELRGALAVPLPDGPVDAAEVLEALATAAEPGVVGTTSPRYFGFVIGGSHPAALAADWLVSTWDQNAGLYVGGPAVGVMEEVAARWLVDLLGLPGASSVGFVTGCQMAHFTALAAARHKVLADVGWNVEERGLIGAPPVRLVVGAARHVTVDRAFRYLGFGNGAIEVVPADDGARLDVPALERILADGPDSPTIVCAQVGEINTGALDPVGAISEVAHRHGAWVHVDGAFGLWAAASPRLRRLVPGLDRADSWATDAHKWLNVPYDSGLAFCAHPDAHRAAMSTMAPYLERNEDYPREQLDWNPEFSRRARGVPVYAALRSLGREGVADLIERCCARAQRFAAGLRDAPGVTVQNDVVLNQVLVTFDGSVPTDEVVRRVQADGTCWLSGTTWRGGPALRISVCNWQTSDNDVDRSVAAILRVAGAA